MSEAIDMKFKDLWLSRPHPCVYGEKDEVGAFSTKGYIFGVQ